MLLAALAAEPSGDLISFQKPVEHSNLVAGDLFALADLAIADGRTDDARTMLTALRQDRDADVRLEASFRLARLDAASGNMQEAAVRYRQILDERPDAQPVRLELAAHLAKMGDMGAARRELRYARAGELPSDVAQLVDRFSQTLRSSKPFGGSVQIGTVADSNINRATRADTLGTVIGDFILDAGAKEHSGYGLSIDSQTYGRVPLGSHQFTLTLSQSSNLYRKQRYNDVSAAITAGPELEVGTSRLNLSAGVTRRWFGGDKYTGGAVARAVLTTPISSTAQGRAYLGTGKITNHLNGLESGWSHSAEIEVEKALSVRMGIAVSISAARQDLRDPGYSSKSANVALVGYRTFGQTTFVGSASLGRLVADERLILYPEKRSDRTKRLGLGATFRAIELLGLSPSAQFSWERNDSTIAIYDYRRRAFELGISRAF